ncbi:MAG: hypothetical protein DRP74_03175 [Candidatus Omnitrophota bacterium]|nr:MAG: hypothetical protein DRP74_03175 [Candidatus Omnitrophota bacterium]
MERNLLAESGFTFLEVLFTVVIIALGLVAIINWVPLAVSAKIKAEQKSTAIFLAQGKIEDIKREAAANWTNFNEVNPQSWSAPYDSYRWTASDDLASNLKTISVSVWHIEDADNKVKLDTKIALR